MNPERSSDAASEAMKHNASLIAVSECSSQPRNGQILYNGQHSRNATVVTVATKNVDRLYRGYANVEKRKADGCISFVISKWVLPALVFRLLVKGNEDSGNQALTLSYTILEAKVPLLYTSTCEIPTLYTRSLKKVPLSGWASPYRPLQGVPPPPPSGGWHLAYTSTKFI